MSIKNDLGIDKSNCKMALSIIQSHMNDVCSQSVYDYNDSDDHRCRTRRDRSIGYVVKCLTKQLTCY